MKNQKELTFKDVIESLIKTRFPIHLMILGLVLPTITNIYSVKVAELNAQIMGGDVFNDQIIRSYVIYTIVNALLTLPTSIYKDIVKAIYNAMIQNQLLKKIIYLPMSYFDKKNGNDLIGKFNKDASTYVENISAIFSLLPNVITIYLPFINLYKINKTATLVYTAFGIIKIITMYFAASWRKKGIRFYLQNYSKITGYFTERVNLLKFIKTSGTEKEESNSFKLKSEELFKANVYNELQTFKFNIAGASFDAIKTILLYGVGGVLIYQKVIDISALLMFINMGDMLNSSLTLMCSMTGSYQTFKGSSSYINQILNSEQEDIQRKTDMTEKVEDITFEDVTFGYNDREILKNVNVTIPKGKVTAIVGPSGSGKTTILKMVERFYEPNKGTIKIGDTKAQDIHLDEYRRSFGYIVQSNQMIPGTIRDNICYGVDREVSEDELIKIAKLACVYDCVKSFPSGFDTMASSLSTGQKQRVSIARAIMTNPNYLILDEATSNVDVENEYDIMNSLRSFMKDKTTIVVAHKLSTIKNADQIIVVDKGNIVGVGKHEELKENSELYKRFCEVQAI